nr:putative ribonuclease H-like domain-containing protein [Tanacetum cinerariifolium]
MGLLFIKAFKPSMDSNQWGISTSIRRSRTGTELLTNLSVNLGKQCLQGVLNDCRKVGIARTPQQNSIAKRKNKTLIEAVRTMLADSLLTIPFWAEAVNTACYVQNRVLVTKPHNKTPYELLLGRTPSIGFMRPFGCPVTILNTLDPLGKFDRNADEGFLVGYSVSSKAFRVFNSRTQILLETFHINFLENKPNVAGSKPTWLFDIDTLPKGGKCSTICVFPIWSSGSKDPYNTDNDTTFEVKEPEFEVENLDTNTFSAAGPSNTAVSPTHGKSSYVDHSQYPDDPNMPALEDITYFDDEEEVGVEVDFSNLKMTITVSLIPTTRVHKDHPVTQIIGDLSSATQTRSMTRIVKYQGGLTQINNEDFHTCMFACFLSQEEPKRVHQALKDPSWIEAM